MVEFHQYDNIVVIEKPRAATSGDAFNLVDLSDDANWVELFTRRAEIRPALGSETEIGSQTAAQVSHLIRMRRDDETKTITPKYRLRLGVGVSRRVFGIISTIDREERGRELEIRCAEQVA